MLNDQSITPKDELFAKNCIKIGRKLKKFNFLTFNHVKNSNSYMFLKGIFLGNALWTCPFRHLWASCFFHVMQFFAKSSSLGVIDWSFNIFCYFISKRGLKWVQIPKFPIFQKYTRQTYLPSIMAKVTSLKILKWPKLLYLNLSKSLL
jgi:hypothetical protein